MLTYACKHCGKIMTHNRGDKLHECDQAPKRITPELAKRIAAEVMDYLLDVRNSGELNVGDQYKWYTKEHSLSVADIVERVGNE